MKYSKDSDKILRKKILVFALLFLMVATAFAPFLSVTNAEDKTGFKEEKLTKTIKGDDGKDKNIDIYVSKYESSDRDRYNANLNIAFSSTENKITVSDMLNTKGSIVYLPVKEVEAKLGTPPYGMYDTRYYPEKVSKNLVDYYVFKIPHFSSVDITDWYSSDYVNRMSITFNTNGGSFSYSNDMDDVLGHIYLTDSDLLDASDDKEDLLFVALSDAGVPEACYYDAWLWDTANDKAWISVRHFLDKDADTVVYLYYNKSTAGTSGYYQTDTDTYVGASAVYHFEGNGNDTLGAYNGTGSGDPDYSTSYGFVNTQQGVYLDSNDYIDIGDLDFSGGSYTILCFAYTTATDVGKRTIITKGTTAGYMTYAINFSDENKMENTAYDTANADKRAKSSTGVTKNTWYAFGTVLDTSANTHQMYYNGVANGSSVSFTGDTRTDGQNAEWGVWYTSTRSSFLNGYLDEAYIFNTAKSVEYIKHWYYSYMDGTSDYYTVSSASSLPTFAITESPTNTTYNSPSSLDINVTITNGTGITFEEANFSYIDNGTTYPIKNRVNSSDLDIKTWSSDKIAFNWDSTNNFPTENLTDVNVTATVYDGTTWYTQVNSSTFDMNFNSPPNAPTITRIGLVDVNATTAYDEDTGNPTFSLSLKGYNSSDPDGDTQTFKWFIDDVFSELFTTPDYNTTYSSDINTSITTDIRDGIWYFGLRTTDGTETNSTFWKMTIDNRNPTKAVITSPTASSSARDTTPAITWTASTDGDGDDYSYCVVVKDGELNVDYNSGYKSTVTSTHKVADILDVDTYNVYVYTYDGFDANVSDGVEFSVIANSAPNSPTITSVGGVTDVNGTVYDEQTGTSAYLLNLKGYNSSDPDGDNMTHRWSWTTSYATLYSTTTSNSSWLDNPADINSSTITSSLTRNAYWYVGLQSKDDYDGSTAETFWKVLVENRVPTKPVVTAPSGETYDTTPSITWSASTDGDGDDFNYCVVIKDSALNVDYNSTFLSSVTSPTNSTALDVDSYNVYIYVYDGWDTNVSDAGSFSVIENTPPNKAVINTIGGVATGNDMYDEDTGAGFKLTMDGTNSSDYDGDAQKWAWIVDDDSGFGSINYNSSYVTPIDFNWTTALQKNKTWYFRVDAIDPLGSGTANSSATFTGTMENYAPNAVTLSTPADLATIYDTTPTFTWSLTTPEDNDGDNVFYALLVYDSGDALDYNSGFIDGATNTNTTVLDLDTYTWKVVAYDNDGTYYYDKTNSSTTRTFTLIENTNPLKPTITSIGGLDTNGTIYDEDAGSGIQITVAGYNSSDPDGDNQTFKWEIDNDSDFGSITVTVTDIEAPADINRAITDALAKNVDYYFRLGSIDPLGKNEYNYSTTIFKMTFANRVPGAPVVLTPTGVRGSDLNPNVTWTNSTDTDGDPLTYMVEISNASGVVRQSAWGVSQPYSNATALDYGDYNVTIYVYDTYDQNTSAVGSFTIVPNWSPDAPTITSVAGASTNSTVYDQDAGTGTLWYLRGYNASDTDGDAQEFLWQIDNNSNFGSPEYSATGLAMGDINRSMTTALNRNTSYYVRLGAIDPLGSNTYNYSNILLLLFENYAPTAGSLTAPDDNSTTCDTTVFMSWGTGTDGDGDSLTMQVRVYDSLGNKDYNNTFGTDVNATTGVLTADTYTWKVVYYDGYDYTNSSTRTFTVVDNTVPSVPTLSTPANFAKDINPATVTLDWADSTDTCGDSITYTVQWSTSYTFTTYQEATSGTSSYAITSELYTEQVYYWRVKATDVIGSTTWSSIYEFQTESASGGTGSDQYEVRTNGAYDKDSGTIEVIAWIQKNGVQMTGISGVSIVIKDEANTTVYTSNSGTVYADGFYRDSWSAVGWHGLYSMKTTLTYSGNTYYGGSYFDAGIMEVHDALNSMTTTINLIEGYTDSLEGNMSTVMTYIGDPSDTSSDSTLFGYSQFLKDKWGSYTAEQIYNKVVDVYNLASDINASDIAYLKSTLSDLDTYIDTYSGVDISVGTTYNFYSDQLELSVAYIKDGEIKDTTSCATLVKESDGDTLKTFTDADDADNIYRYEWNSSAVDFPANGFYGSYTIIPSVVYNGNTYATVRTFSAELPDLYGTTAYSDTLTVYSDSGYSVTASTANAGSYIYLKCTSTTAMSDLSNVTYSVYWEDTDGNLLATTSGTGSVSSNTMRIPLSVPSISGSVTLRLYAYETVYGHRTTTMSGTSSAITIYSNVGSGYTQPISKAEIRIVPDSIKAGDNIRLGFVCERRGGVETVGIATVRLVNSNDVPVKSEDYAITMKEKVTDVMLDFKTPLTLTKGVYELQVLRDGFILDTHEISVSETVPSSGSIMEALKKWRWEIPGTDIVISFE